MMFFLCSSYYDVEMRNDTFSPAEQTRLVIVVALVASAIAALQILQPIGADNLLLSMVRVVFLISAACGLLYVLLSAATLKYKRHDEIGGWIFTERFRQFCYNYCIDTYGVQLGTVILFGAAYALGWNFNLPTWDWRVGIGAILSLGASALNHILVVRRRK